MATDAVVCTMAMVDCRAINLRGPCIYILVSVCVDKNSSKKEISFSVITLNRGKEQLCLQGMGWPTLSARAIDDYPIRVTLNFDGQLDFVPCSQNLDEDTGGVAALQATCNGSQTTFKASAWW